MEEDRGIVSEELQKRKNMIDLYIGEIQSELSNFSTSISGLSNYYKGPGAQTLKASYGEVKASYPKLIATLNKYNNYISNVISGYDTADSNIADSVSSN